MIFNSLIGKNMTFAKKLLGLSLSTILVLLFTATALSEASAETTDLMTAAQLSFTNGTLDGWEVVGDQIWVISPLEDTQSYKVASGEQTLGILRSKPFTIETEVQSFSIAGADGTAEGENNGDMNYVLLRSWPDGEVLRKMRPPGTHIYSPVRWSTWDIIGRKVYLEIVDENPKLNPQGFAWIGIANYKQKVSGLLKDPVIKDMYALKIDDNTEQIICRTLPFLAVPPADRVSTTRIQDGNVETIPVGVKAETIYFLGMINHGWEGSLTHWGEHAELREERDDQVHIGSKIGELEIRYADGKSDRIPLVMGVTSWFVTLWTGGPGNGDGVMEPFVSRSEYAKEFDRVLKLKEQPPLAATEKTYAHYYLAVKPRNKIIESVILHDNTSLRGRPLVSAITLTAPEPSENLELFSSWRADENDLKPAIRSKDSHKWKKDIKSLKDILYTKESDLPKKVELIDFTKELDVAKIRFMGPVVGDMLSNIWVQNLEQINDKFDDETGFFHESGKNCPRYNIMGVWRATGLYYGAAFGRCSDHFASLALRCIDNSKRLTNYVDFCDKYLYFYRNDHNPENGPENERLDITKWPAKAGGHWGYMVTHPCFVPWPINELQGDEEMDGHGSTMVGRWVAWRMLGGPKGEWLTKVREDVYGKSRYDSTKYAAEFVCWLMDYTNRDVIYSEGEGTGWGGGHRLTSLTGYETGDSLFPLGWDKETDRMKILRNYANSDMYEPYPSYVCLTGLRCSAQMADAVGDTESAAKWRSYADRIQKAMVRLLAIGDPGSRVWRQSRYSLFTTFQESLVQAWFAFYYDGIDPQRLDSEMTEISINTLKRQLGYPRGHKPVMAMGYGLGWITKAALVLDHMDDAGKLLCNIAKYSYDKNMDYVDEERGIDWRKFLWIIPEGTNLMPDGRWHRIGDLSNGANQGIILHALELCAGIDDTKPAELKIIPRVPNPLKGLEVTNFAVLIPNGQELAKAKINYSYDKKKCLFSLNSDRPLPNLAVRMGPYNQKTAAKYAENMNKPQDATVRTEASGNANGQTAWWIWIEGMTNINKLDLDVKNL